jgi:hypothetical protein
MPAAVNGTEQILNQDATDRRSALDAAVALVGDKPFPSAKAVIETADTFYAWLRARNTLRISIHITAGPVTAQQTQGEE